MPSPSTVRRSALAAGALALALGTTALTALPGTAQPTPAPVAARIAAPDFAEVAERVGPSVVRVLSAERARPPRAEGQPELRGTPFGEMLRRDRDPGEAPRRAGQGSGFVIDPAGFIVTNAHVVGDAAEVRVVLTDGRDLQARVVGSDRATDIALLKVEAGAPLPALAFGDSDRARVGEWVMAMGNPFGLGGTVTAGIVSARGRQIGAGPYDDFIQTDAPINPGNSGGPLFNAAGEVVGVNTAIFSPSGGNIGIGFAVPARMAQQVVAQLRDHGNVRRGWLGVSLQPLDRDLAQALRLADAKGVLVAGVEPGSPAARAGIEAGDVVTAVDGRGVESPRDLAAGIAERAPGSGVTLAVLRGGSAVERRVELGTHPASQAAAKPSAPVAQPSIGLRLAPRDGGGVAIVQVEPGSVAAARGLMAGDTVLRAGEREARAPRDVVEAVTAARAAGHASIALQVERDGARRFVAVPLQAG
ncbi:Do family serine endopeptidase [Neoroseomonas rubea]|uniref:Do family serine endopeptidase n=1 Tax=Neoroseomonas rubea TaxID=2748666 RepID=UPI0018DFB199|nr:Do family serine endopeptidase [Roseomonas rubea]